MWSQVFHATTLALTTVSCACCHTDPATKLPSSCTQGIRDCSCNTGRQILPVEYRGKTAPWLLATQSGRSRGLSASLLRLLCGSRSTRKAFSSFECTFERQLQRPPSVSLGSAASVLSMGAACTGERLGAARVSSTRRGGYTQQILGGVRRRKLFSFQISSTPSNFFSSAPKGGWLEKIAAHWRLPIPRHQNHASNR